MQHHLQLKLFFFHLQSKTSFWNKIRMILIYIKVTSFFAYLNWPRISSKVFTSKSKTTLLYVDSMIELKSPTLMAVSLLSPVSIQNYIPPSLSFYIVRGTLSYSLSSIAVHPYNKRFYSIESLIYSNNYSLYKN